MKRLLAALLAVVVITSACASDSELTELAIITCEQLDGSIVLTAGLIIEVAITQADILGYTAPELGDKMREECPGIMNALENIGD